MDRQIAQDPGLCLGVLHDRAPARLDEEQLARPEPAAPDRLGGAERHGARPPRRRPPAGRESPRRPPGEARCDRPAHRPVGRRRRRSRPGRPTGRGSRPSAVGAWRRGDAARGAGASASGMAVSRAGVRSQPVVVRSSRASSSDSESDAVARQQRAGGEERLGDLGLSRRRRPGHRTWSRLPRTVLISPLWAIERNGWASRQTGWVFVA